MFLISFFLVASAFADDYIVLFKQSEMNIASLEHGALQQVLQTSNLKSVKQLEQWLGARGKAAPVGDFWLLRGASLNVDKDTAKKLEQEAWVQGVYKSQVRKWVHPVGEVVAGNTLGEVGSSAGNVWGLDYIGVPKIRAEFPGIDGSGIRVGVLDTGVQSKHPELATTDHFKDFVNHLALPYDDHGHGTHVSGTISGKQVGVAPGVTLTEGKIFGAAGAGDDTTILKAMQWIFDPDGDPSTDDYPRVVSNSWGADLAGDASFNIEDFMPYHVALQAWVRGGVIPVFAAGNSGGSPNGIPGGLPEPIAVGAINAAGAVADFSSRGPNLWRLGPTLQTFLKPDIAAPGVDIASSFPGNKFASWAGTSMATPHVTGTIALMLQANPKLKFADVKEILLLTSQRKIDTQYGYGILDAYAAVKAALARR